MPTCWQKSAANCTVPSGPRSAPSGMGAIAVAVLSQLSPGDRVLVSNQLYGRTSALLTGECARLGIASTVVDVCDLKQVKGAIDSSTLVAGRGNDRESTIARARHHAFGRDCACGGSQTFDR